jgi:citrate lyase subunit beta/citryl-CoA lyase
LIESPGAVHRAFDIAACIRVCRVLSFGLMDFVSAHGGAIPASAMGGAGQFDPSRWWCGQAGNRLCLPCRYGKVPSHCVVTEFRI